MEDWLYSSFLSYTGIKEDLLCNRDLLMNVTGYDLNRFLKNSYQVIEDADIHFEW